MAVEDADCWLVGSLQSDMYGFSSPPECTRTLVTRCIMRPSRRTVPLRPMALRPDRTVSTRPSTRHMEPVLVRRWTIPRPVSATITRTRRRRSNRWAQHQERDRDERTWAAADTGHQRYYRICPSRLSHYHPPPLESQHSSSLIISPPYVLRRHSLSPFPLPWSSQIVYRRNFSTIQNQETNLFLLKHSWAISESILLPLSLSLSLSLSDTLFTNTLYYILLLPNVNLSLPLCVCVS